MPRVLPLTYRHSRFSFPLALPLPLLHFGEEAEALAAVPRSITRPLSPLRRLTVPQRRAVLSYSLCTNRSEKGATAASPATSSSPTAVFAFVTDSSPSIFAERA